MGLRKVSAVRRFTGTWNHMFTMFMLIPEVFEIRIYNDIYIYINIINLYIYILFSFIIYILGLSALTR